MSRRPIARARSGGQGPAPAGPPVDPKITSVADWLRNEKRSGLTTKEAVQYEKVCACNLVDHAREAHPAALALPRALVTSRLEQHAMLAVCASSPPWCWHWYCAGDYGMPCLHSVSSTSRVQSSSMRWWDPSTRGSSPRRHRSRIGLKQRSSLRSFCGLGTSTGLSVCSTRTRADGSSSYTTGRSRRMGSTRGFMKVCFAPCTKRTPPRTPAVMLLPNCLARWIFFCLIPNVTLPARLLPDSTSGSFYDAGRLKDEAVLDVCGYASGCFGAVHDTNLAFVAQDWSVVVLGDLPYHLWCVMRGSAHPFLLDVDCGKPRAIICESPSRHYLASPFSALLAYVRSHGVDPILSLLLGLPWHLALPKFV